jgi:hypothetical protein
MHKNVTKCNETLNKWCKNKHGASKIIDTFETYHYSSAFINVISGDTLSHDMKMTVCALCVSLRLNFTVILIMSYDLS